MAEAHHERLVTTQTEDGLILEGAQLTPVESRPRSTVVVWMHGFTGRFYEPHTLAIGRHLADAGYTFVTGNNRGHDLGAFVQRTDAGDSLLAGAWWEDVQASRYDLSAWIDFGCRAGASHETAVADAIAAWLA